MKWVDHIFGSFGKTEIIIPHTAVKYLRRIHLDTITCEGDESHEVGHTGWFFDNLRVSKTTGFHYAFYGKIESIGDETTIRFMQDGKLPCFIIIEEVISGPIHYWAHYLDGVFPHISIRTYPTDIIYSTMYPYYSIYPSRNPSYGSENQIHNVSKTIKIRFYENEYIDLFDTDIFKDAITKIAAFNMLEDHDIDGFINVVSGKDNRITVR